MAKIQAIKGDRITRIDQGMKLTFTVAFIVSITIYIERGMIELERQFIAIIKRFYKILQVLLVITILDVNSGFMSFLSASWRDKHMFVDMRVNFYIEAGL